MLALAARTAAAPCRSHSQDTGECVERALVADHGVIIGEPPIPGDKATHHAVPIASMPDQHTAWLEHPCPLRDYSLIVTRQQEEAKRGEEVHYRVEPCVPFRRQAAHVAARVAQRFAGSSCVRAGEQVTGEIEPIDVVPGLGEQVRMAALTAWDVEDPRPGRKAD